MMETYEAGRGTLRESLRFLELQGVLSFKPGPGGGPVIEKPTADNLATTLTLLLQFDDARYRVIAEAREAFEPVMAQLAASRITPERLVELEQSVTDMAEGIEDIETYLDANRRFHNVIAWASGNALFGHLVDVMGGAMDISGAAQGIEYPVKRRQAVLKAHQEIFEAIRTPSRSRPRRACGRTSTSTWSTPRASSPTRWTSRSAGESAAQSS